MPAEQSPSKTLSPGSAPDSETCLRCYADLLESLTVESLPALIALTSQQIRFSDPFHRIEGQDRFRAVMRDMFTRLDGVCFSVHQVAPLASDAMRGGFLHWTFAASSKLTGTFSFEGTSRIELDSEGLVRVHEDYWDSAALYRHIPGLGVLFRWLQRKAACQM
ncbi:MAG: nuclear transport factor 2 family protein [Oceanospirillaceae bacterium]|nr:nuclear transport factor 2 family protein [Oceanospirillaceae bacterium]